MKKLLSQLTKREKEIFRKQQTAVREKRKKQIRLQRLRRDISKALSVKPPRGVKPGEVIRIVFNRQQQAKAIRSKDFRKKNSRGFYARYYPSKGIQLLSDRRVKFSISEALDYEQGAQGELNADIRLSRPNARTKNRGIAGALMSRSFSGLNAQPEWFSQFAVKSRHVSYETMAEKVSAALTMRPKLPKSISLYSQMVRDKNRNVEITVFVRFSTEGKQHDPSFSEFLNTEHEFKTWLNIAQFRTGNIAQKIYNSISERFTRFMHRRIATRLDVSDIFPTMPLTQGSATRIKRYKGANKAQRQKSKLVQSGRATVLRISSFRFEIRRIEFA